LRGVSILAVMFVHGGLFWLGQGGFPGVDIFFVLSEFLITSLLLEELTTNRRLSFRNFYIRRGLRLLPPRQWPNLIPGFSSPAVYAWVRKGARFKIGPTTKHTGLKLRIDEYMMTGNCI